MHVDCKDFNSSNLQTELTLMYEQDQRVRLEVLNSGKLGSEEGMAIIQEMDQRHLLKLKKIVDNFGWPSISLVGEEAADKMWLLVQHCDSDVVFQRKCLRLLNDAVNKKEALKHHLAYLTDRILVNEGKPQLYGTQILIMKGQVIPRPIEDMANLDKRRKEMGLEPFSEYATKVKEVYVNQKKINDSD